jgi:cytochrome c
VIEVMKAQERSSSRALIGLAVTCGLVVALLSNLRVADAAQGDPAAGAQAFLLCSACHNARPDAAALIGPNLWNVVARPIAGAVGFEYSEALQGVGGTWTPALLDRFLADPAGFAPGTRMGFAGIKDAAERADIVAYLQTLHEGGAAPIAAPAVDYGPDWPPGPGQAEAGQLCNSCHSLTLVKQQKLPRRTWDKLLVWMVEEQGMAEQSPETRELILGYLAKNFGIPE